MILLYDDFESIVYIITIVILILPILLIIIFVIIFAYISETKEIIKKGGVKAYYPNIIKFIVQNYPYSRVIKDTPVFMLIESVDYTKGVTMKFSLKFYRYSHKFKITGTIIPDNSKWAWIPNTEHEWKLSNGDNPQNVEDVIKRIKKDMVFNPTE